MHIVDAENQNGKKATKEIICTLRIHVARGKKKRKKVTLVQKSGRRRRVIELHT